jgi:hypothetical protein
VLYLCDVLLQASVQSGTDFKAETSLKWKGFEEIRTESLYNTLCGEGNDIHT